MKKTLIALLFIGFFAWGVYMIFNRGDNDLKNVGEVKVISMVEGNREFCKLKGKKISKRYRDDITDFDDVTVAELASDAVTVKKPDVIDEQNNICVSYKGDFIDIEEKDIYYSIYDSDLNLLYTTDTLGISFEKGKDYYAMMDVKWGKVKNYVCLRYCFRITT